MTPSSYLASLLPDPPAQILALDWRKAAGTLSDLGHELVRIESDQEITTAGDRFDAVLWNGESTREEVGGIVDRLSALLAEDGQVIVIMTLPADLPETTRHRGSMPTSAQTRLREIVRCLSEGGFAIRQDRELRDDEPGWKILVARRDPFTIRSYRTGDEAAILRLFTTSFGVEREQSHWRWKYTTNPHGAGKISLALKSDGVLVAHYAGYPIPIWHHGQDFLALQVGDTMTDPAVRDTGRGKSSLLARTVRHFFSLHRDGTFGFYFGFNTGPIQRFCQWFLGGSRASAVRFFARDLELAPDWSRAGYRVERVDAVGPAWDRFFRRVAPSYGFLVRRDARYLDWRYLQCPDTRYVVLAARHWGRLVGWSVFRRKETFIQWGDALFHPRHAAAAEPILAAALAQPELTGAERIHAWFPHQPEWWSDQVEELGFRTEDEPDGLGMVALGDAETEAYAQLEQMYYTMGDGDLF